MVFVIRALTVVVAFFCIQGCAVNDPDVRTIKAKTFGVVNLFPEHPYYLKKQTLVAMHKNHEIDSLFLKEELTRAVLNYLVDKGYKAVTVDSKDALLSGNVDMLIQIIPRKVRKIDGMEAYGFADRNFLLGLIKQHPRSYVALQLALSRRHSKRVIKTPPGERFSGIEGLSMPETWDLLSEKDKNQFEVNLRKNMLEAVRLQLDQLKI